MPEHGNERNKLDEYVIEELLMQFLYLVESAHRINRELKFLYPFRDLVYMIDRGEDYYSLFIPFVMPNVSDDWEVGTLSYSSADDFCYNVPYEIVFDESKNDTGKEIKEFKGIWKMLREYANGNTSYLEDKFCKYLFSSADFMSADYAKKCTKCVLDRIMDIPRRDRVYKDRRDILFEIYTFSMENGKKISDSIMKQNDEISRLFSVLYRSLEEDLLSGFLVDWYTTFIYENGDDLTLVVILLLPESFALYDRLIFPVIEFLNIISQFREDMSCRTSFKRERVCDKRNGRYNNKEKSEKRRVN